MKANIDEANKKAVEGFLASDPWLIDLRPAIEVVPGMKQKRVHIAGPPIAWDDMAAPTKGSVIGTALLEGWVEREEDVDALVRSGEIEIGAHHDHGTTGPMAGPVAASTPVYVVHDKTHGNTTYAPVHEGLGKVLNMGNYSPENLKRLRWMRDNLPLALSPALKKMGGMQLKPMVAESLMRGDELHNRCKGGTCMFIEKLTPPLLATGSVERFLEVHSFLASNTQSFLMPIMAASKATLDAINGIPGCTVVTCYARNGSTIGVKISGTGKRWFTAPAPIINGLYFPGYSEKDACRDLGDSAITEIAGLGAFAMAGSPGITQLVGGTAEDAVQITLDMYEICLAEHDTWRIPALNLRGVPICIDVRKIIQTGILPKHNTAISHKDAGVGMIGLGILESPMEAYQAALKALAEID